MPQLIPQIEQVLEQRPGITVKYTGAQLAAIMVDKYYECLKDLRGAPFVLSFCAADYSDDDKRNRVADNGLLSQWRGYSPDGGYAIEFCTEKLCELIETEFSGQQYVHYIFNRVVYGVDSSDLQNEFQVVVKHIDKWTRQILLDEKHGSEENEINAFLECAMRSKNEHFDEEKEVRLCFISMDQQGLIDANRDNVLPKTVHHREVSGMLIPYIKLFETKKLPITKVIVGPHKDQVQRMDSLGIFKEQQSLSFKIEASMTPYVGF